MDMSTVDGAYNVTLTTIFVEGRPDHTYSVFDFLDILIEDCNKNGCSELRLGGEVENLLVFKGCMEYNCTQRADRHDAKDDDPVDDEDAPVGDSQIVNCLQHDEKDNQCRK
jgi:hypothetical protein